MTYKGGRPSGCAFVCSSLCVVLAVLGHLVKEDLSKNRVLRLGEIVPPPVEEIVVNSVNEKLRATGIWLHSNDRPESQCCLRKPPAVVRFMCTRANLRG